MSWSTELWDQFDTVSNHTAKGIDFLDKFGHFIKDRCLIETEYANKLRKLTKSYDLSTKKKDDEGDFSCFKGFSLLLKELSDMAGQHEVIAENLSAQIVREITAISKNLREERKRHLSEGARYQNILNASLNQLDKSKKYYDKSFRESEKAHDNYQKADKDLNLSRADLEKAKTISLNKERACENSKTDYAKQLQVANQAQKEHYTRFMPEVFQQLQDMETRRIECTRNFIKLSAMVQKEVSPIINKCLDGIIEAADSIDPKADAQLTIDKYKSGMQPPDDIPFEDLSNRVTNCETESTLSKTNSLGYKSSLKSDSLRHTFTARGLKKRSKLLGIFGANKNDYSGLPPNQKRKKIQAKIDSLNTQITQAVKAKEGMLGMRQAYEENNSFGDSKSIEVHLRENEATIDRLNKELAKHLVLLEEIDLNSNLSDRQDLSLDLTNNSSKSPSLINESAGNNNNNSTNNNNIGNRRVSVGQESEISRTNSENSFRPDNSTANMINRDASKSSITNRTTSNSFADSMSDSVSNNAVNMAPDSVDGITTSISTAKITECKDNDLVKQGTTNISNNNHVEDHNNYDEGVANFSNLEAYETSGELPAQAFAKALYAFKAEPAGSISMVESELFDVIEFDQGDGWTRVRRKIFQANDEDFIGFVPTSYIQIDQKTYP